MRPGRYGEIDKAHLCRLGRGSASALLNEQQWLFRRVEHISFGGATTTRRISADFAIPSGLPSAKRGAERLYYVPVSVLSKAPSLLDFDLEVKGASAHLLTSEQNAAMDEALVGGLMQKLLGSVKADCLEGAIHKLTHSLPGPAAFDAYADIERDVLLVTEPSSGRGEVLSLLRSLVDSYVLWVPVTGNVGDRYVVHFSYQVSLVRASARTFGGLVFLAARTLALGFGDDYFEVPHVGQNGSYHVSVHAPGGCVIEEADLWFFEPDLPETAALPAVEVQVEDTVAHLYTTSQRSSSSALRVKLMPAYRDFLAGAFLATTGIALLLTAFWRWSHQLDYDPTSSVAILVIVPAVLGLIALRPTAHPAAVARLYGIQMLLYCSGALSIFCAVAAVRYEHVLGAIRPVWRDSAYGAYGIWGVVAAAFMRAVKAQVFPWRG